MFTRPRQHSREHKAALAQLTGRPSKSPPIFNQRPCIAINLWRFARRCTAHLPELAIKTQSRRNQDLQGDAHLPELALRRPERLFERLLLIGQPPPLSLDRVLSTARLRVRESTQRGRRREAHSEADAERHIQRHSERHTQRRREAHSEALREAHSEALREAHSEALTTKSLDAPQRARQPQAARWSQHSRARAPDEGGHQRVISGNQMVPQRSRAPAP